MNDTLSVCLLRGIRCQFQVKYDIAGINGNMAAPHSRMYNFLHPVKKTKFTIH